MLTPSEKTALIWLFERQGTPLETMVKELGALLDRAEEDGRCDELQRVIRNHVDAGVEVISLHQGRTLVDEVVVGARFRAGIGLGRRDVVRRYRRLKAYYASKKPIEVGCRVEDTEDGDEGGVTMVDYNYGDVFVKWDMKSGSWVQTSRLRRIG